MQYLKIKALLVDDESDGREILRHMLAPYANKIMVAGEAGDADEACELITELQPDLVFLDVQMPGKNGFDVLAALPHIGFEVIFVTSYEQYALSAIKFNALDYLLKPLDTEELEQAIGKAYSRILSKTTSQEQIISMLSSLQQFPQKIAAHSKDKVHLISLQDILYIEGLDNYSKIIIQNNQEFIITKPLKDFELYFGDKSVFVRINKSIMVNTAFIACYSKGEPCVITMKNGKIFEVSRRRKQEVLNDIAIKLG